MTDSSETMQDRAPFALADWLALDRDRYKRAPYDRPCPACGQSMVYPTSCQCDFEARVFALAGLHWTADSSRANLVKVNRAMRALDDSSSYPIRNRFDGTERAIRQARAFGDYDGLDGYVRTVDHLLSIIVNAA